ncbi:MAG: alpha/beta fold hydrolase [Acidimicrobiales bacterium]
MRSRTRTPAADPPPCSSTATCRVARTRRRNSRRSATSCAASHRTKRGFGRSTGGPLPTSLLGLADDAVRLCAELGVDRAHVVGLSFGGAVAQALAVHHAGFVTSLVLAGTYRLDESQTAVKQLSTVRLMWN